MLFNLGVTMKQSLVKNITFIFSFIVLSSCSTSPTGRSQFVLLPESQMASMGASAFKDMKSKTKISTDKKTNDYVNCIVQPMLKIAGPVEGVESWEVVVFDDKQVNAFALPGGRIGVYTGIIQVAENADQLAAVIGHEIGHVMAKHGNERVSQSFAINGGLMAAGLALKNKNKNYGLILAGIGVGAQFGILLPFSRAHETESDLIGMDLMAQAGFDPRESAKLWENMKKASGGKAPPEFMSTHPSNDTRIKNLTENFPKAMPFYEKRKAQGPLPKCII